MTTDSNLIATVTETIASVRAACASNNPWSSLAGSSFEDYAKKQAQSYRAKAARFKSAAAKARWETMASLWENA